VAPDDTLAARELVEAMNGSDSTLSAEAYQAIARAIVDSPPALVTAIIPLLKDREEATRRRAAVLLLKVDPKLLP
jgi:HEAT repeat protein